jgi:plasmid maintenance system antidote protein VapI
MSDRFWLNLQMQYDMDVQRDKISRELSDIRPIVAIAS